MRTAPHLFGVLLCLSASIVLAQPLPALNFNPKIPGFQGGSGEPSSWLAENTYPGAVLYVYAFRSFSGDFAVQFRQTLLREFIQKDLQELRLAASPSIGAMQVPGADAALYARFVEDYWGTPRHRLRVAVLATKAVAIVDYVAHDADSFQHSINGVTEMLKSMSVGAQQVAKSPTAQQTAAAKSLAGLYLGSALQFVPSPVLGAPTGSGSWMPGTRFYLLSSDGKVHRGYGLPKAPGGDIRRFDFEKAKLEDPQNSGEFVVEGARVILRLGGGIAPEAVSSKLPAPGGALEFYGTLYKRQPLQ